MADLESSIGDRSFRSSSSLGGDPMDLDARHDVGSSFVPSTFRSILDLDNLSLIQVQYGLLSEFKLELSGPSGQVCNPPPSQLGLYEEAL